VVDRDPGISLHPCLRMIAGASTGAITKMLRSRNFLAAPQHAK